MVWIGRFLGALARSGVLDRGGMRMEYENICFRIVRKRQLGGFQRTMTRKARPNRADVFKPEFRELQQLTYHIACEALRNHDKIDRAHLFLWEYSTLRKKTNVQQQCNVRD